MGGGIYPRVQYYLKLFGYKQIKPLTNIFHIITAFNNTIMLRAL